MKVSELATPTPEVINEVKQSYNRVLKRCNEASKYLDDSGIPKSEKEKRILMFRIEIVDVLEAYLKVLQSWGVEINDDEIIGGMRIE